MTYYYVDDTGTATGDAGRFATAQTGAFTNATSYASVYDVFGGAVPTTAPVAGDFIVLAHDSLESWATDKVIGITDGVTLISASATARETYQKGAIIQTTAGGDLILLTASFNVGFYSEGVSFYSNDRCYLGTTDGCHVGIKDGGLQLTTASTTDFIAIGVSTAPRDGALIDLDGVDITTAVKTSAGAFWVGGGSTCRLNNITVDGRLFRGVSGLGGATIEITNSDLSDHDTSFPMVNWTLTTDDSLHLTVLRCKIPAGFEFVTSTITYKNLYSDVYSCDTGDGYHYFEHQRFEGKALESTTVKRTGGATYDGTNGFSAEFQPNSNVVAYTQPLRMKIAELELDLTSANTLTFHLAFGDDSSAIIPFNNDEAWIEIEQNSDALTSKALGLTDNTKPDDILTTPTQLTASTEEFTSNATTLELDYVYSDKRQIAIDTVAVSGMTNGQVTAYLCIAKHVTTLEIFGCPSPVVT